MLAALQSRAEADTSKAWAAARDNLPAATRAVGAIDLGAVVKTPSFGKLLALLMKEEKDFREGYEMVKKACKVEPSSVIEGVVFAGDPTTGKGVAFLQLTLDRAKATACLEASLRAASGNPKASVKAEGNLAALSVGGDTAYVAWVTGDVVAIAFDPEKKDVLQAWIGQKGAFAKTAVPGQLGKVDTKAIAWGAMALDKPLDDDDLKVLSAHGALTLARGAITGALRGTFVDAKAARDAQTEMQQELTREIGRKSTPEPVKRVLRAINLTAKGTEVALTGTTTEADLLELAMTIFK
jgi:hypothetical protein